MCSMWSHSLTCMLQKLLPSKQADDSQNVVPSKDAANLAYNTNEGVEQTKYFLLILKLHNVQEDDEDPRVCVRSKFNWSLRIWRCQGKWKVENTTHSGHQS